MLLSIYDSEGIKKAEIAADDSSTQVKEIQGDNVLTLSFTHYEHIALDVNDSCVFESERYWLMERYAPKQKSEGEWKYDIKLYGIESLIKRFLVLETTDGDAEPVFRLTATPREHVAMIVKCINDGMNSASDWKVGQVDGVDLIVIDYEGKYCNEALKEIAQKVGGRAEWWVDGQTVNVCRCEHGEEVTLAYGEGLTDLERDTSNTAKFYTRLFPIGSSRNIDSAKYGHSRLMLPGGRKYVEYGVEEYGIYDHYESAAFSGIYPRRLGTVSSVRSEEVKDENGNPFTIYYFKDSGMDFDPNDYELAGETKRVSFQDGDLAGLGTSDDHYFEINFDSETREFEIITIWPYDDVQIPGGVLIPKVGDHYILWNIRMPDEYYPLAEAEFQEAVDAYNAKHWQDISVYKAPTDHVWIEDNKVDLFVGLRVRLESKKYFPKTGYRQSRITKITRKVNLPSQMDLEISDALQEGSMQRVEGNIDDLKSYTKSRIEGLSLPDLIRTGDNTPAADTNIYSAKRSAKEFLSKRYPDIAEALIRFLDGVEMGRFISGIETGTGAAIDAQGNAEVMSLISRTWIKAPFFIYNKVSVTGGEMWNTEGGTIAAVEPDGDSETALILTMEIEDGDAIDLQVDDICKGHYNSNGGFVTSYFRVTSVDQPAKRVRIVMGANSEVPGGQNHAPLPFMNIARYGNFTNRKRQRSQYFSSSEMRIALLDGVDQYIIEPRHYKLVIGDIPAALLPDGYPLAGDASIYLDNVLARNFFQIDKNDNVVRTIRDRGLWSAATAIEDPYLCNERFQDDVYHISCKWRCLVEGTTAEPRYDSPDWLLLAGDTTLSLDIESSEGDTFLYGRLSTTLKARVRRGVNDITAEILPADWSWTRDTGDLQADTVWNTAHANNTNELKLTNEDLMTQSGRFICEAYVRDGAPQTLHAEVIF